jgi:serine/threonine protein kinase
MHPALENYSIIREIGSGGMSVVFEATDKKLQRTVALKMLHPHLCKDTEAAARFKREALAAARMDHPHIVRVYDYLNDNDAHYIVMEYVPGTDMESVQKKEGKVESGAVITVMGEIASAMAEAHRQGIIHRDIKPANILIHQQGRAMLTDFGLAHHGLESRLTQENAVAGTPVYMSPEQISGKKLTPASDVYSWAVTLYCLLSGKLPYASQNFPDIVPEIQQGTVVFDDEALRALPAGYRGLLGRCLQYSPAERVQSGIELNRLFDECKRDHPLTADISLLLHDAGGAEALVSQRSSPSKTNLFSPARRSTKKRLFIYLALIAGVCAAPVTLYFISSKKAQRPIAVSPVPLPSLRPADTPFPMPKQPAVASGPVPAARAQKTSRQGKPAASVTPAPVDSGRLFVYCAPWATVYIDDRNVGNTPLEKPVSLPAGIHRIRLYNRHCLPREDTVTITARTILRKRYALQLLK